MRAIGNAGKFIDSHKSWFYYFYSKCLMREDYISKNYQLYSLFVSSVAGKENSELLKSSLDAVKKFSNLIYNIDDEQKEEETVTEEDLMGF